MPDDELPEMNPLPDYGDLMTWEDFESTCKGGAFIDTDGSGYMAIEHAESTIPIRPSQIVREANCRPKWATHVMWYNK